MTRGGAHGDPASAQLRKRVGEVTSEARLALGLGEGSPSAGAIEEVESLITLAEERLRALAQDEADQMSPARGHRSQLERLRERHESRALALSKIDGAVARLRRLTSPGAVLSQAAEELCTSSQLDRVLISMIRDGRMVAETAWFRDTADDVAHAIDALRRDPPPLEYPLIEADLLRRRRASIVSGADVHPRVHRAMAETMGWSSFVAAPVIVRGDPLGIIHADTGTSGRQLDVLDADVLWAFAAGLAEVYETISLRRALRRQQAELRDFAEWLDARSSQLSDASIEFGAEQHVAAGPPGDAVPIGTYPGVDDRSVFEDVLTRRELEVLRLLARGETNRGIAAALVISEGTVKFHVSNILGKLHAGNRAEAVSRYHRLLRLRR